VVLYKFCIIFIFLFVLLLCNLIVIFDTDGVVDTGTLHVGDEIREINGASVQGQSVEKLQKTLVRTLHVR